MPRLFFLNNQSTMMILPNMKTINAGSSVLIVCCREKVDANEKNSALKIEKQSTAIIVALLIITQST